MKSLTLELFPSPIMVVDYAGEELALIQHEIGQALESVSMREDHVRSQLATTIDHGVNDIITQSLHQLRQCIDEAHLGFQHRVGAQPRVMHIYESWFNRYQAGGYMSEHEHPGAALSGVYYYQADGDSGSLWFRNPNSAVLNGGWPAKESQLYQQIPVQAQVGRLVLFPSWLAHSVGTVKGEDKISISFNLR
jgi:uncharacterized protein (TIGR02466 family)